MISIIIPVYNHHDLTEECIAAVRENTADVEYELIAVDNGSTPEFKPPFTGFNETILIRNDENKGFPVAVNQGIAAATGDIIILLNNDVIVTPEWAERLTRQLETFAIVGPVTNFCAGAQKVTVDPYETPDELHAAARDLADTCDNAANHVSFVIGFLMAFKKSLWEEIGPFDESLFPCSGEEIDFCLTAREAGHKIGMVHDVYVHHYGSQTFDAMEAAGELDYMEVVERNEKHLSEKWGDDIWGRQLVWERPPSVGEDGKIRLNLGSGKFPIVGFVNVDQFENVNPEVLADVTGKGIDVDTIIIDDDGSEQKEKQQRIPPLSHFYGPGSVDEIYCGHMLEHLGWDDGQEALRYWWELLVSGGEIRVTVPNFDVLAEKHLKNPTVASMKEMNDLYMFSYVQESPHLYFYSGPLLKSCMAGAGFVDLEQIPIDHPYLVDPVDWQIGYKGVKP